MSTKKVLLVVREDQPQDPKRQLEWLEQNIFPESEFPLRRLVYVGSLYDINKMTDSWKFHDAFTEYGDLYSKLRGGGYFVSSYREPSYFDFALLIHIRRDFYSGMGYGLEECRGERCLLRAMMLAARGNVLFCDWGLPMATRPDVTREELVKRRVLSQYIYTYVSIRRYPDLVHNAPFTKVVDHFLNPVYEADPGLPAEHMDRIKKAINGTLFTDYQLKLAMWNAWWNLYFASDAYCLVYHQSNHFHYFQRAIIYLYLYVRGWTVSSSWLELVIDSCGFVVMSWLYGVMSLFCIVCADAYRNSTKVNDEWRMALYGMDDMELVVGPVVRYAWWMAVALIFFNIRYGYVNDRIPIWTKLMSMLRYSLYLPIFDIWLHIWLTRDSQTVLDFLIVWLSLGVTDLVTFWFLVPVHRNCVTFALLGLVTSAWVWRLPHLPVIAQWMLEQGLWMLPLFARGRLRLHPELKRSFLYLPWIVCVCILLWQYYSRVAFLIDKWYPTSS